MNIQPVQVWQFAVVPVEPFEISVMVLGAVECISFKHNLFQRKYFFLLSFLHEAMPKSQAVAAKWQKGDVEYSQKIVEDILVEIVESRT